jgi:hypothetical protein
VATIAAVAERTFVMVILLVAAHTVGVGSRELIANMAALAGHDIMKTNQWEVGEMMVETINDVPTIRDMAGGAHLHFRVLVNVIRGMTGGTVARQIIL